MLFAGHVSAQAKQADPHPLLTKIHHHVRVTHHYQKLAHIPITPYLWVADHTRATNAQRTTILHQWHKRAVKAVRYFRRHRTSLGVPSWFAGDMVCIGIREEGGSNSSAGRYGFVFPPSSYGGVATTLGITYGESWLNWPQSAQLQVAYMLYNSYGWSPWSTAGVCGLA